MTAKQIIDVKVLPGEPTDGSGRVSIHLFVRDESGTFVEPNVMSLGEDKRLQAGPTRGRLACNPKKTFMFSRDTTFKNGKSQQTTTVTPRSDDPRAVTCPKCKASTEYVRTMELITAAEAGR